MAKRIPRLRIIAGPNGSGKSTLVRQLRQRSDSPVNRFSLGYFLNADDLEISIRKRKFMDFNDYGIAPSEIQWQEFHRKADSVLRQSSQLQKVSDTRVIDNKLFFDEEIDSYIASSLIEFLREQLLAARIDFSFETVFSHESKIVFIEKALELGYRVYIYYVATDSYLVNVQRVKSRALKGGHDVSASKIKTRYIRSLELLPRYITKAHRSYIWDNSGTLSLVAEITNGESIEFHKAFLPHWVNNMMTGLEIV